MELHKAYVVLPAADNEAGFLRIIDESGGDYLYPVEHFLMDYLSEAKHFHKEAIEPYKGPTNGATAEEIAALEQEIGFALPEAYRQYLLWMGKDYEGCFVGSEWFLHRHYNARDYTELVTELYGLDLEKYPLPKHFFLFFHHQAYEAAWFLLPKESEDPPVYYFNENDEKTIPVVAGTFTEFLIKQMGLVAPVIPRLYERRK